MQPRARVVMNEHENRQTGGNVGVHKWGVGRAAVCATSAGATATMAAAAWLQW